MQLETNAGEEVVEFADVYLAAEADLDMACPGPEFDFRSEVEPARIFRRPHVDGPVGEAVDFNLLAG